MTEVPRAGSKEEYLRGLQVELIEPQTFELTGVYNFQEKENPFTGSFQIGKDGKIVGVIDDKNSPVIRHVVHGVIEHVDKITTLRFVKIPGGLYADIHYLLSPSTEDSNQTRLTLVA